MRCKKGGFISIRHNDLRDLTANMIPEVCNDTETEPKLTPLSGEKMQSRTSNNSNETRVDIRILGTRAASIFRLKNFRPQHLLLSRQIPTAVLCYE